MEINNYAPVLITTLNRYEHFKRCLDSLERCTGADKTDVYIGLDYPPSEKYVDGWKKIDAYLKEKEKSNSFRNLYVRRRDHNCGVGKTGSNSGLLYVEIKDITDRFISSEDDNEFSPCFLEYLNKALEKYKDDERVVCVCGYSPFDYDGKENIYFAHQMFAWGYGRWIGKMKKTVNFRNLEFMEKALKSIKASLKIYRYRPIILNRVMDQVIQKKRYGDVSYTCFCLLKDRYCIYPSESLVRNWGYDGTGVHCKKTDESFVKRKISQEKTFELDNVEVLERKEIRKQAANIASKKWYGHIAIALRYLVWRITNKDFFSVRRA